MDYSLEFVEQVTDSIEEKMQKDLVAYETSHGIDFNYKKFALVLTASDGELVGVLQGYTVFAEIYVDNIWVHSSSRGRGYGSKLLQELESRFQGRGFNNINLCTSAFQAPAFYQKCGFTLEFVRQNAKNPQLSKSFFVKYFQDQKQTQGVI